MYFMDLQNSFGDRTQTVKNSYFTKAIHNISVPLWQQVIDWFRNNHNIIIAWNLHDGDHSDTWRITISHFECYYLIYNQNVGIESYYKTYEEAREQAILKAIELIKTNE